MSNEKPTIIYSFIHNNNKKYNIDRKFNAKEYKTIYQSPKYIEVNQNYEKDKFLSKYLGNEILYFIETITQRMSHCNLSFLHNNLKSVKITNKSFIICKLFPILGIFIDGFYDAYKNELFIRNQKAIYHELFHLASAYYSKDKKIKYCGFSQKKNKNIGYGINEGYTQLLSKRYFADNNNGDAYSFEVAIVKSLENIVGKEKMEQLYMSADLYGLVDELKKYNKENNIMDFIKNMDYISNNIFKRTLLSKKERKLLDYTINKVLIFLIKSFAAKASQLPNDLFFDSLESDISDLITNGQEYSLEEYQALNFALSTLKKHNINLIDKNRKKR